MYSGTYGPRRQNVRLLEAEIKSKIRLRVRNATVGIVGCPQTGKKTLAFRFGEMNRGPFQEEVPRRFHYVANFNLDNRLTNGTGDVFLRFYIMPPPSDLSGEDYIAYYNETPDFSFVIFICSVIDKESFLEMMYGIGALREELQPEPMPPFLVVGNKSDLHRAIFPHHFTHAFGLLTTHMQHHANYEECSAKENINVDPIVERILISVIAEDP